MTTTTAIKYANPICYSDVRVHEIVRVISDTCVEVRRLKATLDNWQPEFIPGGFAAHCINNRSQRYVYTSDETEEIFRIRKSRSKSVRKGGKWFDAGGHYYKIEAEPYEFHDYNF